MSDISDDIVVRIDVQTAEALAATNLYDKAMQRVTANLSLAAKAQAKYDAAVATSGASSDKATAAQVRLGAALARTTEAEQRAAIAAAKSSEIQAAASAKAAAAADKAAAAQSAAAAKITASRKAQAGSLLQSTTGFSAQTTGVLAVGAAFIYAAKSAADFDQRMASIHALNPAADLSALAGAAKDYADLGVSATSAADAEIELVKAGISTRDILAGGLQGTLTLAAAGELDVADAASIAAQAMTEFGLQGDDLVHVADLLSAGANKALGSVQDLGTGLSYAGGPAHTLGVSIEDTVATLAEFAQAGLIGEKGGAALQTMFARLVKPTAAAQTELDKYNITLYDSQGQFVGMSALAGQFQDNMGGLSLQTRNAALQTIFGNRAFRAAAILYNDGAEGAAKWRDNVDDAGNAARTAHDKLDSLNGDLTKLKASLQNLAIDKGEGSQGPLRGLVQGITDSIGGLDVLTDSFNAWDKLLQGGLSNGLLHGLNPIGSGLGDIKELFGGSEDDAAKVIPLWDGIDKAVRRATTGIAEGEGRAGNAARAMGGAMLDTADSVSTHRDVLRSARDAANEAADAEAHLAAQAHAAFEAMLTLDNLNISRQGDWDNFAAAIDDATQGLKDNGRTLDQNTEKGRANRALLRGIASDTLAVASDYKKGSDAQVSALEKGRAALYKQAIQFGLTKEAAREYVDKLLDIPDDTKTRADFDTIAATQQAKDLLGDYDLLTGKEVKSFVSAIGAATTLAQIDAIIAKENYLQGKHVKTYVDTILRDIHVSGGQSVYDSGNGLPGRAGGGPIGGVGSGTSDSNLIRASRGEHMLTKREVDNAGGHAAIFAMRRGLQSRTAGMAVGGPVGRSFSGGSTHSSSPTIVVQSPSGPFKVTFDLGNGKTLTGVMRQEATTVVEAQARWASR